MTPNPNISSYVHLKTQIAVWVFMTILSITIIPFNLFHNHSEQEDSFSSEVIYGVNHGQNEADGQCDHEIHVGAEQQLCLLCHFAFMAPVYHVEPDLFGIHELPADTHYPTLQETSNSYLSIHKVLNKGSPFRIA